MDIVLVYNQYENLEESAQIFNPHGAEQMRETVWAVAMGLKSMGHRVTKIEATNVLLEKIEALKAKPDVIFNLSAGITNKRSQANIVGMLEMLDVPIVGSGLATQVLSLHKKIAKILLQDAGVRTAKSQLFSTGEEEIREDFEFPVIVKPEHEGSSVGITESSKVLQRNNLRKIIQEKIKTYNQMILVEEFLPGREFTVGILGNDVLEVLPIKEYIFEDGGVDFLTIKAKADDVVSFQVPAELSKELEEEIVDMAKRAFLALRCRQFARIDFRLDHKGQPHVIELNTLPGLQKGYSDFPILAEMGGYSYEALLDKLVTLALERRNTG
ncbi:MAG: ATP-grasp domain-containing protein [Eubacteriaceae bacterium]|jgi:D-alanine-D-alanine ligase|nr:ATP-grasp domain-containing protein [Eubacteriaceae bacterium]